MIFPHFGVFMKSIRSVINLFNFLLGLTVLFCGQESVSQKRWDRGANSNSWYDAANWHPDGVPSDVDTVLLDNSLRTTSYTINLPGGQSFVPIKRLRMRADSGKTVTLILPNANIATTGFRVGDYVGSTKDILIERGGILINNAGGDQGPGIQLHSPVNGIIEIQNGGKYIHRTKRPADLASRLTTVPGTENGIFEYDVPFTIPDNDFVIETDGISYGTLVLREVNTYKYITDAAPTNMTVRGDFNMLGGFQLNLTGNLLISGDVNIVGNLSFGAGTQTFELNGTKKQFIDGTSSTLSFENVTFNNTAGFEMKKNILIDGAMKLLNGKVNTGIYILQHGLSAEGNIQANLGSWVVGFLSRYVNATATVKVFPVGSTTDPRRIDLSFTTAPITPGVLDVAFINQYPGNSGLPLNDYQLVLHNIAPMFWIINSNGGLSGGTYTMTLRTDNLGGVTNINKIRILKRDQGGNWFAQGVPGQNSNVTITREGMSGFSEFGIAGTQDNPLPVDLKSFSASESEGGIALRWFVENESFVRSYSIERAVGKSGDAWKTIGAVSARGCCTVAQEYSFLDSELLRASRGVTYRYRLRVIDYDGTEQEGGVTEITLRPSATALQLDPVYPNPVARNNRTTINYFLPKEGAASLSVYNMLGQQITTLVSHDQAAGSHSMMFDTRALPSGYYFYQLRFGGITLTRTMVVTE